MTQFWEPGTQYNPGDVVEFEGHRYKNIQGHRSQSDWTPSITPALWGRLQDGDHGGNQQQQQYQQQPQQGYQQSPPGYQQPNPNVSQNQGQGQQGYPSDQKVEEEKKQGWFDDKHKKQFEIGGALAAGAALLGGGFALYKHHEKSEEQKKTQAWATENWMNEAKARTDKFFSQGPTGPATWVLTHGGTIPNGAIEVGREGDSPVYIARAFVEGGIQIGKASPGFEKPGALIGFRHDEIYFETYEILLGNMSGLRWEAAHGRLNVSGLGYRPVEGGREDDGTPLYVAQALYKGAVRPGKASEKLDGAYVPYHGDEKNVKVGSMIIVAPVP